MISRLLHLPLSLSHNPTIHFDTSSVRESPFPIPPNVTSAAGNTYKNVYEATTMSSGLYFVLLVNIAVAVLGILFYRYVILRGAGLLSPEDARLLKKYPAVPSAQSYTPTDSFVTAPPPMRWTTWPDFFTASENALSRDAQVYLLFQRACLLTTAICAFVATIILMPCYWLGGAVFKTGADRAPSLLSLLKSDRGVFERFTSHNLSPDSPLFVLQLPVIMVTAFCIIVMYTVVKAAAGEQRSVQEWLFSSNSNSSPNSVATRMNESPRPQQWTLFARGLPQGIQEADDLANLFEALYPEQVVKVELVCKGRMSEARLLRALSSARNRLEYLCATVDEAAPARKQGIFSRVFGLLVGRRSTGEMINDLEERIEAMHKDFESRKAEHVTDFTGCAFITFRSASATASALEDFPVHFDGHMRLTDVRLGSSDLTIGRHSRGASEWRLPGFQNLYKGTLNLLPYQMRERLLQSSEAGSASLRRAQERDHSPLAPVFEGVHVTPEVATAKLRNMKAERAPKSGDIIWQNIGISFFERTVREMVVQVVVFAVLILFTSPVAMLTAMKLIFAELALLSDPQMIFTNLSHHNGTSIVTHGGTLNETNGFDFLNSLSADGGNAAESLSQDVMDLLPPFLTKNVVLRSALLAYLPVLLLGVVLATVPTLLRLTCSLEGYPTYSAQEMSVFRKTSFYYVMNAVVLPSVALNTASEFLEMIYKQSGGGANVYNALPILERLFSGDIAFFLCSYLIQLALTGSIFWLLALPSNITMMIRRRRAVSPLEEAEAKCSEIFDYPRHYAYSVTVMSMCLLFGFMAPLIWHFALFYFVCKHSVDVYTIRYVHPPTHIDGRLPRLSSNFILTWTTVSQLSLAVIFYLHGWVKAGVATALFCLLTLTACVSVSHHVGNRLLRYVASLRDRIIQRIMRVAAADYDWMAPTLVASSSTSSSTQSLPDARENDALLLKDPMVRRISLEIGSMKFLRTSSVRPGSVTSTPEAKGRTRSENHEELPTFTDLRDNLEGNGTVYGSDFGGSGTDSEDIEGGCGRPVTKYGTCDPVDKENIPRREERDEVKASSSHVES